ncbi:MAG: CoA transferase [Gammaproteobacteria bacterium]|nr:CoA transferase [Gammaproteobacteria bacterium]
MTGPEDRTNETAGPLRGVRVIEFGAIGPVPFCAMLLADMGAEILRIDPPSPAPLPDHEAAIQRGRHRVTLDLKNEEDAARLHGALPHADILLEGFRPGVLERLGFGPDQCLIENPALVIGRMTGWGQTGPLAPRAGHDPNYLALTGALHAIGYPDRPPLPPLNLIADQGGGAMFLAVGILAALLHARATGQGQVVDAAMIDGAASLLTPILAMRHAGLWRDERGVNMMDGSCPFATSYGTADGKYVVIAAIEPKFYAELLRVLGLDPATLPAQHDTAGWPLLRERFAAAIRTRTRDEWARVAEGLDACLTPVLDFGEAQQHPHQRARAGYIGDPPLPAPAPRFSATPTRHATPVRSGAAALLRRWGMTAAEAAAWN